MHTQEPTLYIKNTYTALPETYNTIPNSPCRILLLPVELLIRIFTLAQNPALAIVCHHFYNLGQADTVRAHYLIYRYGPKALTRNSLQRKIVSLGVVEQLLRLNYCDPKASDCWLFNYACDHHLRDLATWVIDSVLTMEKISIEAERTLRQWLNMAASKGSNTIIDLIVDQYKIDIHDGKESALTLASANNQLHTIKHLVSKYNCNIHVDNERLLRTACLQGFQDQVKYMIQAGCDVHEYHDTALQNATYRKHDAIVKLLLDAGANPSTNRNACIKHAIKNMDLNTLQHLITAGADPRYDGDWPLRYVCRMGHENTLVFLINTIPVQDLVNLRDGTLLKDAITNDQVSTIKLLLKYGAKPNSSGAQLGLKYLMNPKLESAHKAVIIQLLLDAGMDSDQQSNELLCLDIKNESFISI